MVFFGDGSPKYIEILGSASSSIIKWEENERNLQPNKQIGNEKKNKNEIKYGKGAVD